MTLLEAIDNSKKNSLERLIFGLGIKEVGEKMSKTLAKRYKDIDSWYDTTYISEDDFDHIQEIVDNAGQLEAKAPYNKLVDNTYAEK